MAHGGAWDWDNALDAGKHGGLERALGDGYSVLRQGGSALDAVEATVVALENDPVFDAGTGGYLNQDGVVQLDALIVDGESLNFGAVAGVTEVQNPIVLARRIMERTEQCFFVGEGANHQAERLGLARIPNEVLVTPQMQQYFEARRTDGPSDTVGAIAMDADGNVAAATSTSGTPYKPAGRVGDSPFFGAGGYARNGVGAAGATGQGEQIMRSLLSKHACDSMKQGATAAEAAGLATKHFKSLFGDSMSALIVIDRHGNGGASQTAPKLAFGWVDQEERIHTSMRASELLSEDR